MRTAPRPATSSWIRAWTGAGLLASLSLAVAAPPVRADDVEARAPQATGAALSAEPVAPRARCLPCDPALRCGSPRACGDLYVGAGGSLLPNVGGYLQLGRVFHADACSTWSFEIEAGWQPIDDKDFIDDGNPPADDWVQLQLGVKRRSDPLARRHWVSRAGAFAFDAGSEPNWVDTDGVWAGAYVGFGFETDISPSLSIGPTLTLMAGLPVEEDGNFDVVPQLTWGLTWWPGAGCGGGNCERLPKGEVYLDLGLSALPGVGQGSVGFGQVFARGPRGTWSLEVAAVFQDLEDGTLQAESNGDLAQLQGGLKLALAPQARAHLVLRAGASWLRTTGRTEPLKNPGDYVGAYASVGYEWDLGCWLSTGPEALLAAVAQESGSEFELVPRLAWHVIVKF